MFKRTRQRLVILNALVFFILLNLLGGMAYFYTKYSLYHQVDHTILEKKYHLINDQDDIVESELSPEREENHRLAYLLWDKNGKLYGVVPKVAKKIIDASSFSHLRNKEGLQSINIGPVSYRYVNLSVANNKKNPSLQSIQIVYNLQRENEMLDHLLFVIGFGSLISRTL